MNFSDVTILCIGDLMLDRFVYCDMERISPEAPVPVLPLNSMREMPGGAGNVANNIASLGGRVVLTGLIGRDDPGRCLRAILAGCPSIVANLVDTDDRPTVCKTRFIVANAAASVVVSKLGTATASMAEVLRELALQDQAFDATLASGTQSLARVRASVQSWKQQGRVVGFTNGCFDILHPGHIALLAFARAVCDRLVVALNSDASARLLKGPTRPVNPLDARAQVIAALRHVDCIVSFDAATPIELIRDLLPDVLVKGADYEPDRVVGAELARAAGGVLLAPLMDGHSTTGVMTRLQHASAGGA